MIKVEFIYDDDCPNVAHAREQLQRAFADVGLKPQWQEWNRGTAHSRRDTQHAGDCGCQWEEWNRAAAEIPGYVRDFGSPTVLIDGKDVAGASPANTPDCCRVYRKENGGLDGVPSVDMIASALRQSIKNTELLSGGKQHGTSRSWLAVLPGVGLALLPNVTCPACWPMYMGLLSSFGVGFMVETTYLLPLTVIFLIIAVGTLGFRAKTRRGYAPFLVGLLAATLVIVGKFVFSSDVAWYSGVICLVGVSLWNSWPRGIHRKVLCPACATTAAVYELEAQNEN